MFSKSPRIKIFGVCLQWHHSSQYGVALSGVHRANLSKVKMYLTSTACVLRQERSAPKLEEGLLCEAGHRGADGEEEGAGAERGVQLRTQR